MLISMNLKRSGIKIKNTSTKQDRMALRRLSFICFFLEIKLRTVDDKIVSPLFVTTSSVTKYQNREDHRSSMNKKHPKEYLSIWYLTISKACTTLLPHIYFFWLIYINIIYLVWPINLILDFDPCNRTGVRFHFSIYKLLF